MSQKTDECWEAIGVRGNGSCPKLKKFGHCRNCHVYVAYGRSMFEQPVPDAYRAESTAAFAEPQARAGSAEVLSLLVFRLRDEWLALKTAVFKEAAEVSPIRTIPLRSGKALMGLVNVHGELLPCVSALSALGIADEAQGEGVPTGVAARPRFLVLAWGPQRFVLSVDEVQGIVEVPTNAMESPPITVALNPAALTRAVVVVGPRVVNVLDDDRFLSFLKRSLET